MPAYVVDIDVHDPMGDAHLSSTAGAGCRAPAAR